MKNTTLCYLEQNGCYLMLHRVKKQQDENAGKWIGIGGKLEENESPEECCCREFLEETGLTLTDYRYRGIITFVSDRWEGEYMHLFSATAAAGASAVARRGTWPGCHWERCPSCPSGRATGCFYSSCARMTPFSP